MVAAHATGVMGLQAGASVEPFVREPHEAHVAGHGEGHDADGGPIGLGRSGGDSLEHRGTIGLVDGPAPEEGDTDGEHGSSPVPWLDAGKRWPL